MVCAIEHELDETIALCPRIEEPKPLSFRNHVPQTRTREVGGQTMGLL
jgi:hypothetical protein